MTIWLKNLMKQFKEWRENNAQAHASSRPGACCSAPPPGAGGSTNHGNRK